MKLLFVTSTKLIPMGTGLVVRNLMASLPQEVRGGVACFDPPSGLAEELPEGWKLHGIFRSQRIIPRGQFLVRKLVFPLAVRQLVEVIRKEGYTHVVGVFAFLDALKVSYSAALEANKPFFPYLHDPIYGLQAHLPHYAPEALRWERKILTECKTVFVMSEGMVKLYREKYSKETIALPHIYRPTRHTNKVQSISKKSFFFGGKINPDTNQKALERVLKAVRAAGGDTSISDLKGNNHQVLGEQDAVRYVSYPDYSDYLGALRVHQLLLIALNYPEETAIHHEHLSTVFPTKMLEYLDSGIPIFVHAPEHYFVSQFVKKYYCGEVVSARSIKALIEQINKAGSNTDKYKKGAEIALKLFDPKKVVDIFISHLT